MIPMDNNLFRNPGKFEEFTAKFMSEDDKKPLIKWFDKFEAALKKLGTNYQKSNINPTDAIEYYYDKKSPEEAAKALKESVELNEAESIPLVRTGQGSYKKDTHPSPSERLYQAKDKKEYEKLMRDAEDAMRKGMLAKFGLTGDYKKYTVNIKFKDEKSRKKFEKQNNIKESVELDEALSSREAKDLENGVYDAVMDMIHQEAMHTDLDLGDKDVQKAMTKATQRVAKDISRMKSESVELGEEFVSYTGLDCHLTEENEKFAGCPVFELESDDYVKAVNGKSKYSRWAKTLNMENETSQEIKKYAHSKGVWSKGSGIVVKDKSTGMMSYLIPQLPESVQSNEDDAPHADNLGTGAMQSPLDKKEEKLLDFINKNW